MVMEIYKSHFTINTQYKQRRLLFLNTKFFKTICQKENLIKETERKTYERKLNENNERKSFIYNDKVYLSNSGNVYTLSLPFKTDDYKVENSAERKRLSDAFCTAQKRFLHYGVYMFLTAEEIKKCYNEAVKRAEFKKKEHIKGDCDKEIKRISTGIMGEFAVEKFTGFKSTDFSAPSLDSRIFDVPDIPALNCGVKTTTQQYMSIIAEPQQKTNQIIATVLNETMNGAVLIRGFVPKEVFREKKYQSYNMITQNSLLLKSLMFNTKIGLKIPYFKYKPIDINEIAKSDKYKIQNLILGNNVDLSNVTEGFVNKILHIKSCSQSMLLYVNVNLLDSTLDKENDLKQVSVLLKEKNNDNLKSLIEISAKYKIGIVFYDNYTYKNMKQKQALEYFPNYMIDKYCIGVIDKNGNVKEKNL